MSHPPPTSYASDFTSPVTFSSISLSDNPANSSLFSLPKSKNSLSACCSHLSYAVCPIDPFSMADIVLTVSGKNLWLCPCRLADHDWCERVVLLHRRVRACEKRSVSSRESVNILNCVHACAAPIQLIRGAMGVPSRKTTKLAGMGESHLVALLVSPVWHIRNRTSLRPLVNAYLPDMVISLYA